METHSEVVTVLLKQAATGDQGAIAKLIPLVYKELHRVAENQLRRERPNHTLQPTALVHEAFLKLVAQRNADWQGRAHFFAVASQVMRRILVDYARERLRAKRGGREVKLPIDKVFILSPGRCDELLALDESLERWEAHWYAPSGVESSRHIPFGIPQGKRLRFLKRPFHQGAPPVESV